MKEEIILLAIALAESGVDYKKGKAFCPLCGKRIKTYCTKAAASGVRIRFHRCNNSDCILQRLNKSIKSCEKIKTKNKGVK